MSAAPLDRSYELAACIDCGATLTIEEDHYYGYRCEGCEGKWFARVEAWRHGAEDKELDESMAAQPTPFDNP